MPSNGVADIILSLEVKQIPSVIKSNISQLFTSITQVGYVSLCSHSLLELRLELMIGDKSLSVIHPIILQTPGKLHFPD